MVDRTATLEGFLAATAARTPTPGGGAVAGAAGGLAAAIGEMVLNYSLNRKNQEALQPMLTGLRDEFARARSLAMDLMEQDQLAYTAMTDARKLPVDDPARPGRVEASVAAAIRVPQAIASLGMNLLELAGKAAPDANPYLLSDLLVCCDLAQATVSAGLRNVRINLPAVAEVAERGRLAAWCDDLQNRAGEVGVDNTHAIRARIDVGT